MQNMKRSNRRIRPRAALPLCAAFLLPLCLPARSVAEGGAPPEVEVWLDRDDGGVYHAEEPMTIYFKVDRSAYVTVYNIDTDGLVRILYPYYRGMDQYVAGGRTYSIPGGGYDMSLTIDEPTGMGHIEALASDEPFELEGFPFLSSAGVEVETERRVTGDPFLAIDEINREILPYGDGIEYRDDFALYYVEEVVHYPRYVCSDCHAPGYYHYQPYVYTCPTYYIVVYDYWYANDFYYWDHYYAWDYYGYYYRYPVPAHVGHHYSRKYAYRTRDAGVYRTKGESTIGDGVIRVRGYEPAAVERAPEASPTAVRRGVRSADDHGTTRVVARRTVAEPRTQTHARETARKVAIDEGNGSRRVHPVARDDRASPEMTPRPSHRSVRVEERGSRGGGTVPAHREPVVDRREDRPSGRSQRAVAPSREGSSRPPRRPSIRVEEGRGSGRGSHRGVRETPSGHRGSGRSPRPGPVRSPGGGGTRAGRAARTR